MKSAGESGDAYIAAELARSFKFGNQSFPKNQNFEEKFQRIAEENEKSEIGLFNPIF